MLVALVTVVGRFNVAVSATYSERSEVVTTPVWCVGCTHGHWLVWLKSVARGAVTTASRPPARPDQTRWPNELSVRIPCWVRALVELNDSLTKLILVAFSSGTRHYQDRARTGWSSFMIMWLSGDTRSWCSCSGLPVRQHYKITMSGHCHKSVYKISTIADWDFSGRCFLPYLKNAEHLARSFKVIGLTRPGLEPMTFSSHDLSKGSLVLYLFALWYYIFLEDLYCLSSISLNRLVFTITRQLVNRKPEPTLLPTWGLFNLPDHIDMAWEQLAFDDTVSYTQQWKSKLAKLMAWGIEPLTIRLGVRLQKKVRHPNHSAADDART